MLYAKRVFSVVLSLVLLGLSVAAAQVTISKPGEVGLSPDRLKRINELIQRRIDAGEISGAVTLVARSGRVVHMEAQGLADIDSKKPMTRDTVFQIASMTKPVTGVAIMMLVEEGKVRLTDPVWRHIPELRGLKVAVPIAASGGLGGQSVSPQFSTVPADREITVRDLLTHVSGLVSGPISNAEAAKSPRQLTEPLGTYIPRLAAVPLEFQPGSRWSYSSAGFDTLARIVEVVSGQNFDQFLQERIFSPLGLKDTSFNVPTDSASRRATSYERRDGRLQARIVPCCRVAGSGGLWSTAEDYWVLGQLLANGGQFAGRRLLGPRTVDLMASPHAPDTLPGRYAPGQAFGLSMRVVTDRVKAMSPISDGSFGWNGAQGTYFWVDPKEKIVAILMVQTPISELQRDFEQAVMQAVIE